MLGPLKGTILCVLGRGFESMDYHIAKSSIIWNRQQPGYRKNYIQVFGHNSPWGHTWFQDKSAIEGSKDEGSKDEGSNEIIPWGVCLDSSSEYAITAMHWPSLEIFQEKYYK